MITTVGLNLLRNALAGDVSPDVNYFAVGDDNTAVTGTETTLGNETLRVQLSSDGTPLDGDWNSVWDILDSDGALTIREIGWFSNGTASADSGVLISRILYSRDKTTLESIQFNRTDTIGRG